MGSGQKVISCHSMTHGSEITKDPELKFINSYRVTRCHSIDEFINSSNKSYNIDEKRVISEEESRVFSHV